MKYTYRRKNIINSEDELLRNLVQINTAGKNESAVATYLKKIFDENNIQNQLVEFDDGRSGLIASIGNGNGPTIAFDGHEDTVALGDTSRWQVDPLAGTIINDKFFGRGITDMKSGLAAGVVAMLRLKQHEASLNGTFKLFATVGEESGELGAEQMVRLGLANEIDALLVGEPSGVPVEFVSKLPKEASLPGIMLSENIHEVVAKNSINEQHFLTIAHKGALTYKVKSQGITAHSSMPELGVNAIDTLVNFINQQSQVFQKIERIKNDILGATTPVVTEISGGEQPNTVPGSAEVSVFIRTIPEVTHEEILSQISRIIDGINANSHAKLTLETDISLEAVYSQKESKLNRLAKLIGERVLQQSLPFIGVSGGTDASQFVKVNPNLDFLVFGPGNISAHQVDEFVYTNIYHSFIDIYEEIIRDYLK